MTKAPQPTLDDLLPFLDAQQTAIARLIAGEDGSCPAAAAVAVRAGARADYVSEAEHVRWSTRLLTDPVLRTKAEVVAVALETAEFPPTPTTPFFAVTESLWHAPLSLPSAKRGVRKAAGLIDYVMRVQLLDPVLEHVNPRCPVGLDTQRGDYTGCKWSASDEQKEVQRRDNFTKWLEGCQPEAMRKPAKAQWVTRVNSEHLLGFVAFPKIKSVSDAVKKLRNFEPAFESGCLFALVTTPEHAAVLHAQGFGVIIHPEGGMSAFELREDMEDMKKSLPHLPDRSPFGL